MPHPSTKRSAAIFNIQCEIYMAIIAPLKTKRESIEDDRLKKIRVKIRKTDRRRRKEKSRSISSAIRLQTLTHKIGKHTPFSNYKASMDEVITELLNTSIRFNDLDSLQKLMICSGCMFETKKCNSDLILVPFVYRVPERLRILPDNILKNRIQKQVRAVLGDNVQFWLTNEYAGKNGNISKHLNGEALIEKNKIHLLREAFNSLYGKKESRAKYIAFCDGREKRHELAELYGINHAILNWAGYSSKEFAFSKFEQIIKAKNREKSRLVYISRALNQAARLWYNSNVFKRK